MEPSDVLVCIETDRGPWVKALIAAGYTVFGVDPKQAARHREILSSSGAKSDKSDAHALADMVRTRRHQLRQVAADSDIAAGVKVVARTHQTMIWERTRHMLRLRVALREYFPAALEAYAGFELTSRAVLALLAKAPTPAAAAKLTPRQIAVALKGCRDIDAKAAAIQQGVAVRAPRATRTGDRRVRGDGAVSGRGPDHVEHRDREFGEGSEGPFWPAPGR
jgi:hypothetical protein